MSIKGYSHTCEKKTGGINRILITEISNIKNVAFDTDNHTCNAITLADGEKFSEFTFAENCAAYQQRVVVSDGISAVEHRLEFALDTTDGSGQTALARIVTASVIGVAAIVTTAQGHTLLIGYSAELLGERALRLAQSEGSSGHKPTDSCSVKVVLASTDTSPARIFTGKIS